MAEDLLNKNDDELEDIKRRLGDGDNDLLAKVAMELNIRRRHKEDELKLKQLETVQKGLEYLATIAKRVGEKPVRATLIGVMLAVITGVLINIATNYIMRIIDFFI